MSTKILTIIQGSTFKHVLYWEALPYVYKPITAITKTAPVSITATAHGMVSGQRAAVVSVLGMTQINAGSTPPKDKDFHEVTVVDANTVTMNGVNAALYNTYASGGYLQYYTPVDMSGYTARMSIKDKVGGTVLLQLSTTDSSIVIDNIAKTVTLKLSAIATAAITWSNGVYDLEMVSPTGEVTKIATGAVTVTNEVTT